MESINWKVEGMTCSNCALSVTRYLEKEGMQNVKVNPIDGDVHFEVVALNKDKQAALAKGISSLGYLVVEEQAPKPATQGNKAPMNRYLRYMLLCLPFTLVLMLHMIPGVHFHWLMNPWLQLTLCLPVYVIGMSYFGRSAWKSLRTGLPNMNVLVTLGATAAFVYSLAGTLIAQPENYLFYETAAAIITLVFLGNYLEDVSIHSTQKELNKLVKSQRVMATMIAYDDQHNELHFPIENTQLKSGDLILIKNGEQVPADAKILTGEATANEAIITGESEPVLKKAKDSLIGGSLLIEGTVKAQVTAAADQSVLANIINLVKKAQGDKPPVQRQADKISAVFVPLVLVIALLTFLINFYLLSGSSAHAFRDALMRSIAVLVIACPCAMGLATPAAIAVGLGRAARNGILFRNAKSLEAFKDIRQVVFDKTGTLTTGRFSIVRYQAMGVTEDEFRRILVSMERYSNHPVAKVIMREWKTNNPIRWAVIEELKGKGMKGSSKEGDTYFAGSYEMAVNHTRENDHNIYVLKNNELIGWVDVLDEIRPEAAAVINYLHEKGIKTILLSGDRQAKTEKIGIALGIQQIIAEKSPEEKLALVESLNASTPTAMVGDGINDAPALAKASIGISLSDASQVALQTADVVLMNHGLTRLPEALGLGKHTLLTIKQNLFWAFAYNIVAIPVAATGLLTPAVGALIMGLSDVVLAANSVRLFVKKVR
ncbi:cation-translocating P-type ATPase [Flavihumibacter sp. CACIAM 22H1]|uniref:heavy metal translocating P-type ATPase n=1 Tax=Flavihumibacter sp. CACIAM 22H1 TaxID=1812911 RepID=UPI0007A88F7F|nr:cation-translocating P-type ATPase [Flavihumibacter sp. CACIAM 22H1]KYP16440.1 MAG: ATPase P [Flavihumibacter sp. CACIAM 22H1]